MKYIDMNLFTLEITKSKNSNNLTAFAKTMIEKIIDDKIRVYYLKNLNYKYYIKNGALDLINKHWDKINLEKIRDNTSCYAYYDQLIKSSFAKSFKIIQKGEKRINKLKKLI